MKKTFSFFVFAIVFIAMPTLSKAGEIKKRIPVTFTVDYNVPLEKMVNTASIEGKLVHVDTSMMWEKFPDKTQGATKNVNAYLVHLDKKKHYCTIDVVSILKENNLRPANGKEFAAFFSKYTPLKVGLLRKGTVVGQVGSFGDESSVVTYVRKTKRHWAYAAVAGTHTAGWVKQSYFLVFPLN